MSDRRLFFCLLLLIWILAGAVLGNASAANFLPDRLLHSFDGPSGRLPELENLFATLNDQGKLKALYGTTIAGGEADLGVLFKFTPKSGLQVIHSFGVTPGDGITPYGNLIMDESGNLYGTTWSGYQGSVAYKIAPDGSETILHHFTGQDGDGAEPVAGVVMDRNHNLFGSTFIGGKTNQGTIFEIAADGTYSIRYDFNTGGRVPAAGPLGIVLDEHGNIFGVSEGGRYDWGTVYRLTGDVLQPLHQFTNGDDGSYPGPNVLLDSEGNLYGTTQFGGAYGGGVVFKVTKAGAFSVVYAFKGQSDGADPVCQLIADSNGVLYGGEETVLHAFRPRLGDGTHPLGGLVADGHGNLFGTTDTGGASNMGTIFQVTPRWLGESAPLAAIRSAAGPIR
jgi:uncharacterized repeat protein (TIGR03803 family)